MTLGEQSFLIMVVSIGLYVTTMLFFAYHKKLVVAGFASGFCACLPLIWQFEFTDSEAPGFVLLWFLMFPISLGLIVLGTVYAAFQFLEQRAGE